MKLQQRFQDALTNAPVLMDPTEIRIEINKPDPERPGYLITDRQVSLLEFEAQVRHTLSTVEDQEEGNAEEHAEWISMFDHQDTLPNMSEPGDLVAFWRYGGNEGHIVDIAFVPRSNSGTAHKLVAIKYLNDKTFVQRVSNVLNEALYEGGFN
jgi:hypothetical protein